MMKQTRKQFMKRAGAGIGAMSLGGLGGCTVSKGQSRPNIVLVTLDTLGKKHLGCYGYRRNTSPNLDRFAEESIVFEDTYSASNRTMPGHASILTGLHPHNHGTISQLRLDPDKTAIGDILSQNDYFTTAVTSAGFLNPKMIGNGFESFHPADGFYRAEKTIDLALDLLSWMESKSEQFFLWVHLWDAHSPYSPPRGFRDKFAGESDVESRVGRLYPVSGNPDASPKFKFSDRVDQQVIVSQYDGEIAYLDHQIGRLLSALTHGASLSNTIAVITSDHGEALFENSDIWFNHEYTSRPVVEIPLIVRHPDYSPSRMRGLCQSIDLMPTILAWAGIEPPPTDGRNVSSLGFPFWEEIHVAECDSRFVEIINGRYKMRVATGKRSKPLPVPSQWHEDLILPRIIFDPATPRIWEFEKTEGTIGYSWKAPPECEAEIVGYDFERVIDHNDVTGGQKAKTIGRELKEGSFVHRMDLVPWTRKALSYPRFFRVTGVNQRGEVIAASEPVLIDIDSPDGGKPELYDLANDPDERRDVAAEEPVVVSQLLAKVEGFRQKNFEAAESQQNKASHMSEEDSKQLQALGYV